jgi:hypothetical protein
MKTIMLSLIFFLSLAAGLEAAERRDKVAGFEEKLIDSMRSGQLPSSLGRILIVSLRSDQGQPDALKNQLADVMKRTLEGAVTICEPCFMTESAWLKDGEISRNYLDRKRIADIIQQHSEWGEIDVFAYFQEDAKRLSWRLEEARSGDILSAGVVDQEGNWTRRTISRSTMNEAAERRAAGQPLMHTVLDIAAYPSAFVNIDFLEQWGEYNNRFTGIGLSLYNPTGGVGISHYQIIPRMGNAMVGAQFLLNIPAVLSSAGKKSDSSSDDEEDESTTNDQFLLNLMLRYPLTDSGIWNVFFFVSTSASVGAGISLIGIDL